MKRIIIILSVLVIFAGCANRQITIRSQPEGAKLIVDSQEIGVTPHTFPFTYYGTRQVILQKDGYETQTNLAPVSPPFIHIFPFDLFMFLIPYPIENHYVFSYILSPKKEIDVDEILKHGEELKAYLNEELR
ncbi:MAG: PEGA domain-containing protein [Planctomycetes bacterium]|nr:PEGA domain-containing protein [Planctomycetota bacterium]